MSNASVWRGTTEEVGFPCLEGEVEADVAIVGGGITGITLAMLLAEAGRTVAVLEARGIGQGSTGNSTGNLYAVLSEGLSTIATRWGDEVLRAVAESRRAAVDLIERTALRLSAECRFRRCPLHLYATTLEAGERIRQEFEAARRAGLGARLVDHDDAIPVRHHLALVLERQAQFHPLAYVRDLARRIAGARCRIFEHACAIDIDEEHGRIVTAQGMVRARDIVLATHTPKGRYLVHGEMTVNREYGLALRLQQGACPDGILWGEGDYRHSMRSLRTKVGDYLVVVGEDHPTGKHDAGAALARLESFARSRFDVAAVDFRWSAQSYRAADGLPYIGRSNASSAYIATGFGANGLTYGTLAATLIADQILGRRTPWAELYRADRLSPVKGAAGVLAANLGVAKALAQDYLAPQHAPPLDAIPAGSGAVVEVNGEKLAAYRDEWGALMAVSPVCPHMKCQVHWNDAEKSWDCPCHGSRFDVDGRVIEGPALAPLERRRLA